MIIKIIIALVLYDLAKFIIKVVATAVLKTTHKETVKKSFDERIAELQARKNKL
jgi:type II secretory pathway component PulC